MPLTRRQKRALIGLSEPLLRVLFGAYRVATLDLGRDLPLSPRRILVVRLDSIGDVLLSEPAISALRRRFPKARLDVVAGAAGRAILEGHPGINNVVLYEAPWHAAWRGRDVSWMRQAGPLLRVVARLRRRRYDLVCELRGDFRDIAFAAACGARARVGSGDRGGDFFLTRNARQPTGAHHLEKAFAIASACGAQGPVEAPRLFLSDAERSVAGDLLPQDGGRPYVAFHLGAGFPSKCLPVDRFARAAGALAAGGARLALVGGPEDAPRAAEFKDSLSVPVIDLVGRLTVRETAAVLERCGLFVGNDSGPMHLAAAVGTPVVAAFGPSDAGTYHPWSVPHRIVQLGLPCSPCDFVNCSKGENLCLTGIRAEELAQACLEMLHTIQPLASGKSSGE